MKKLSNFHTNEEYVNMFEKNAKFVERKKAFKKFAKTMEVELNENDVPDVIEPAPVFKVFNRTIEAKGQDLKLQFDTPTRLLHLDKIKVDINTKPFLKISIL